MRGLRVERGGRGWVRGLFLFSVMVAYGCEKPTPVPPPDIPPAVVDAGHTVTADVADVAPDLPPPPPEEFRPPWTELAPSWDDATRALADTKIGTMSGEAWGVDVPVHGLVRAQCGSGALLQVIFKGEKGLRASPVIPLRFFGLPTSGKPVGYQEGTFSVTATFTHDTPERVAGNLAVKFDKDGQEKTFIDLTVDGKPMTTLFEPKLDGDVNVPEFPSCHPSGRFYARAEDGRVAQGFLYAGVSSDGKGIVLTPHLTEQTGLRVVVASRDALTEPWKLDLSRPNDTGKVRLLVDAVYTPELTRPAEAAAQNMGSEQTVSVRSGLAEILWSRKGKNPEVSIRFTDLRIPELIEGPLRGTMFTEFLIEAAGIAEGVYPAPPPAEPLTPAAAAKE